MDEIHGELHETQPHDPQGDRHQHPDRVEVHDHPQHLQDVAARVPKRMELARTRPLRVVDRNVVHGVLIRQECHRNRGDAGESRR